MNRRGQAKAGAIKRLLAAVVFMAALGGSQAAFAQTEDAAPAVTLDAAAAEPAAAPEPAAEPAADEAAPEEGSNEDLVDKLKEVQAAYKDLQKAKDDDTNPIKFAIAGLIAAIANLLVSGIKRAMKLTGKAKKVLPWLAMALGAVGGIAGYFAGGLSLFDSILYGGAALGAVVLQELGIGLKSQPKEA